MILLGGSFAPRGSWFSAALSLLSVMKLVFVGEELPWDGIWPIRRSALAEESAVSVPHVTPDLTTVAERPHVRSCEVVWCVCLDYAGHAC